MPAAPGRGRRLCSPKPASAATAAPAGGAGRRGGFRRLDLGQLHMGGMPAKWHHGTAGIHRDKLLRAAPADNCPGGTAAPLGARPAGLVRTHPGAPLRGIGSPARRRTFGRDGLQFGGDGSPGCRPAVPPGRPAPRPVRRRALRRHRLFSLRTADATCNACSGRAGARAANVIRRPPARSHLRAFPPSQALLAGLSERGAEEASAPTGRGRSRPPRHRSSSVLNTTSSGMPATDRWRHRHRPPARLTRARTGDHDHVQIRLSTGIRDRSGS